MVAPLAAYLPIPAMAGILFLVAWGLIDFHHIAEVLQRHRKESIVLAVTFIGTLVDLEKGIFFGIIVSLIFYLYRTSRPSIRPMAPIAGEKFNPNRKFTDADEANPGCPQMEMLRMEGSIFFGAVDHVQQTLKAIDERDPVKKHVMLFSRAVNFIDLAGAEMLAAEAKRRQKAGRRALLWWACSPVSPACWQPAGRVTTWGRKTSIPAKALRSAPCIPGWTAKSAATATYASSRNVM